MLWVCNKVYERIILIVKYLLYNKKIKYEGDMGVWVFMMCFLWIIIVLKNYIYYFNVNKVKD